MTRLDELGYPVVIGGIVQKEVATLVAERGHSRVVILCDKNVESIARRIARAIKGNLGVVPFVLGERRKTLATVGKVLDALARVGADRGTLVIGVGGGVGGDLFGFAASIYMRGVPYLNVATSLVAMVDASVGGKTGVDLAAGKNLAGTFKDPIAVVADIEALATLPDRFLREGLAELVKHGIIEGNDAFDSLETLAPHPLRKWPWETVVSESVRIKAMYVNDDRFEAGAREVLNLGHTVGHAIERASDFRITHGNAVSIGLRAAGLLAMRTKRFSTRDHLRVLSLLALLRLPLHVEEVDVGKIVEAMGGDKKKRDGSLRFVLPRSIGDVEYGVSVPAATIRSVITRCTHLPGDREFR